MKPKTTRTNWVRASRYRPTVEDMVETAGFQQLSCREGGKFDYSRRPKPAVGMPSATANRESTQTAV